MVPRGEYPNNFEVGDISFFGTKWAPLIFWGLLFLLTRLFKPARVASVLSTAAFRLAYVDKRVYFKLLGTDPQQWRRKLSIDSQARLKQMAGQ